MLTKKNFDFRLASHIGMTRQNLVRTYKNSLSSEKRNMYKILSLGFELFLNDFSQKELILFKNFKEDLLQEVK
ncbi:MAG: hypothetical protein QM495_12800 [Lutibacter sp.]|uniref:hypothetical protein n=1 Tax=Lutibacter sp. TaxID=1925666 RepID=UPI00385EF317